jgi:DNA repair exonuclease SbcCD nuclease subunit
VRVFQTADWQIGMRAAHAGEAGVRVREERLAAARRVAEAARGAGADFCVVAGDTFEDNGVDRLLVQKVVDILAGFGGPVYVLPGNHDPLVPGSIWEHPAWRSAGDVAVLRDEQPVEVPGGLLFPCPARSKHSGKDPTAWMPPRTGDAIRIGVAHGTVEGTPQEEPDYPIARDAAVRAGLDYLALGHWHSTATYPGPDGAVRMAYSGTHETTKFGERDSGNALIVEIPAAGSPPVVTPVRTGGLSWVTFEEELRAAGDLARLRERIEAIKNPASVLVELRIGGVLAAADRDEMARLQEILASRFLFGRVEAARVRPSPEDQGWLVGLPAGVLHNAGARLRELADPAFAGVRPEGATAEVAATALLELYALMGMGRE